MAYVARGWAVMFGIERDQNLSVTASNGSAGAVGLIDAGVGQTDIVENRLQLIFRNFLVQHGLDFIAEPRSFFYAQASPGAYVQAQQACVYLREKILTQKHEQPEREQAERQETQYEDAAMLEGGFQLLFVGAPEIFKLVFEAALEAPEETPGCFGAMLVPAHDEHDQRGDEGSRKQVAGQHREADGLGQRHEQKLGHARQEEHGHEHDADAERGYEGRHGDLLRTVEDGLLHLLAHGQVALDIFDLHRSVVDQDADGERQSSQGHDVDGLADGPQHDDRNKNRERDGNGDDDGGTPVAQEDKDHDGGESRGDRRLAHHARN